MPKLTAAQVERVIASAISYLDKLRWIPTNISFSSFDLCEGPLTNDFMFLFGKEVAEIPANLKAYALHKKARAIMATSADDLLDDAPLQMNCWSFCFMVLADANIISQAQIEHICRIIHLGDNKIDLVETLYLFAKDTLRTYTKESPPAAGDIILFKKDKQPRPYHAAIAINDDGKYMELFTLGATIAEIKKWDDETILFLPLSEVRNNIQKFIESNQETLSKDHEQKITQEKILEEVRYSDYYLAFTFEQHMSLLPDQTIKVINELLLNKILTQNEVVQFLRTRKQRDANATHHLAELLLEKRISFDLLKELSSNVADVVAMETTQRLLAKKIITMERVKSFSPLKLNLFANKNIARHLEEGKLDVKEFEAPDEVLLLGNVPKIYSLF
jgi:hypothetical protein